MAEKKTERKTTRYVVLARRMEDDGGGARTVERWEIVGEFDTHGQDEAKRAAAEKHGAGSYAACPASSWKVTPYGPRTVMVPLTGMEES